MEALGGLTVSDACTADGRLVVFCSDASSGTCPLVITRTYVVTDACGNSASFTQTINVDDTQAPVITGTLTPVTVEGCTSADVPAALTSVTAIEALGGLTVSDACTADASLTVSSSDASSGTCPLVITRTYVVTDACGNSASFTQTINVSDTEHTFILHSLTHVVFRVCTSTDKPAAL